MKKACFFNGSGVSDAPAMLGLLGNIYLNFLNAKIAFGPEEPAFVISFLQNSTFLFESFAILSLLQMKSIYMNFQFANVQHFMFSSDLRSMIVVDIKVSLLLYVPMNPSGHRKTQSQHHATMF